MLKKIGAIAIVDAVTKLTGYLLLPIYLGLMPKVEFGEFGFLISALGYASLIVGLYLYVPLIRNYSALDCESEKKDLVSTIFIGLLVWLLIVDAFIISCKPLLVEIYASFFEITTSVDEKFFLAIAAMNTGIATLYCYSLLIARKSVVEITAFIGIKFIVVSVFSIMILYFDPWNKDTVYNRLVANIAADLSVVIGCSVTIFKKYLKFFIKIPLLKANLKIAVPLIPSAIIGLFVAVIDRRLIAHHHGLSDLANYNLAMQALAPIQMLMTAVQVAWSPYLFSIKDRSEALSKYISLMATGLVLMIGITAGIFILMYYAIHLAWISSEYTNVPLIIIIASAGAIANALIHLNNNMFVHMEITMVQLVFSSLLLIINVILNYLLVPILSAYGAAISAGVSNVVVLLLGLIFIYKFVNLKK